MSTTQEPSPPIDTTKPPSQPPPPSSAASEVKSDAAGKDKPNKPRRWRRRLVITLLVLVAVALALRITVLLALPSVLRKVAGYYDLKCTYERLELSIVDGNFGIWQLELWPKEGGARIAGAEYCRGRVSTWALLRGRLDVWRLEADGVTVDVDREPDGRLPLLERLRRGSARAATADTVGTAGTAKTAGTAGAAGKQQDKNPKTQHIDLASPLKVEAFRLQPMTVRFRDRSLVPQLDTTLVLNVRASNIGSLVRPATFDIELSSEEFLDSLRVQAERIGDGDTIDANLVVTVKRLNLRPAAPYLAPVGIRPVAGDITLQLKGHLKATTRPAAPDTLTGRLDFHDVRATADGRETVSLGRLLVDVDALNSRSLHVGSIDIDHVRGAAHRTTAGYVGVAGIELLPLPVNAPAKPPATRPSRPSQVTAVAVAAKPSPTVSRAPAPPAFDVSLSKLRIGDVKLAFDDQGVRPAVALAVDMDELTVRAAGGSSTRPAAAVASSATPLQVSASFHVPGVARSVKIAGTCAPFDAQRTADLSIAADGLCPQAVKPYLDQLGLESLWNDATFNCRLVARTASDASGVLSTDARLSELSLKDGQSLFDLADVNVKGASFDPDRRLLVLKDVQIVGPSAVARIEPSGRLQVLGFRPREHAAASVVARTTPAPATNTTAVAANRAAVSSRTAAPAVRPPTIQIDRLTWKGLRLALQDQTVNPPTELSLSDAGLELSDILLDPDPKAESNKTGQVKAWIAAPGVVGRAAVEGTIAPKAGSMEMDLRVMAHSLTAAALKPYLKAVGIEPVLRDGNLTCRIRGTVNEKEQTVSAKFDLTDLKYTDGDVSLASVDAIKVEGVTLRPGQWNLGAITLNQPAARALRDKDGTLVVGGVRLLPRTATSRPASVAATHAAPPEARVRAPATAASQPNPPTPATAITLLSSLHIVNATFDWEDLAAGPTPIRSRAIADVELGPVSIGGKPTPADLHVVARAEGIVDKLSVSGQITPDTLSPAAKLAVNANGLNGAVLAAYLPPDVKPAIKDGRLTAQVDAAMAPNPRGGQSVRLAVDQFDYRDAAAAKEALFKFDTARVVVPRLDPPGGVIAVQEITLAGVQTDVRKLPDGSLGLLGVRVGGTTTHQVTTASPQPPPATAASPPVRQGSTTTATTQDAATMVAQARKALPLVTAEKIDLAIARLTFTDGSRPQATPVTISDLHLRNVEPIKWLGPDAAGNPPSHLELTGRIDPLVDRLALNAQIAPFARQPTANLDLALTGIRGDGFPALFPEFKPTVDGSSLTNGVFRTRLEATARLDRRGAADFDFSRGFDLDLLVKTLEYRATPDGPVLAGVEELRSDGVRVLPRTGSVRVKSLEVTKPVAEVSRDASGLHALGWTIKPAKSATQPTTAPTAAPSPPPPAKSIAMATTARAPTTKPTAEIRIDRLIISGLDIRYADQVMQPPLVVPLTGLDVEVRGLSNWSPYEDKPIRFAALVNSGKVSLPKKPHGLGIPGAIGDAAAMVAGQKIEAKQEFEERELFSQVAAVGKVSLYPKTTGWVRTTVSGVELAGFAGAAKEGGVNLSGGTFDDTVDLRFQPDGVIEGRTKAVFTDLEMSEPKNGPIVRHLSLPAPLDAVIKLLQSADGSITLNVGANVKDGKLEGLGPSAVAAVGGVIATAVASAPVKAVTGVAALFGISGEKKPGQEPPVPLAFQAGDAALDTPAANTLNALIERMRKDKTLELALKHDLGGGDLTLAEARANPNRSDCEAMAYQLRARKLELSALRADMAGLTRARLASGGAADAAPYVDRLRAIDRELATTEDALDRVYEMLRPGAERQAARRTRTAALELARARLATVRTAVLDSGIPDAQGRIKLLSPQFSPAEGDAGGQVIIALTKKK
ncbi:MAG TPA: DUF748 domain-containing protein [Tepidisphaeraceae bacterium]|jgi:hypothetical protein